MITRITLAVLLILGAMAVFGPANAQYTYMSVDTSLDYPNATASGNGTTYATGINNVGQVVGYYWTDDGICHGFVLTGLVYTPLNYPGAVNTYAYGINDQGHIVGWYSDSGGSPHGFLLTGSTYTPLDYPDAAKTYAYGINDKGQIVGTYVDSNGTFYGFVYSSGSWTVLSYGYYPYGINNEGQIVGNWLPGIGNPSAPGSANAYGFLLMGSAYTPFYYPAVIQDGEWTYGFGINDKGHIAGTYWNNVTGSGSPDFPPNMAWGYLLTGSTYTPIRFPGSYCTFISGINDTGLVVGYYADGAGGVHGFLAMPSTERPKLPVP
jgi:probable HAF family extracellular repeat protein